jgi:hypothetical protein
MASNINYVSIDATFPLAGRDNDSQGFRDNFNYIKNSLMDAKSEITDIQDNGVRIDQSNDFGGNESTEGQNIVGANFLKCSEEYYNGDTTMSNVYVDYRNGSYQGFQLIGSNIMLTLDKFPVDGKAGKMRLHISSDGIQRSFYFASQNGSIKKSPAALELFNKTNIRCTATIDDSSDHVVCDSNTNLQVNQPIKFTGTPFGGLQSGTTYYIRAKSGTTQFSLTSRINTSSGVADISYPVSMSAGSGTMYIESSYIATSNVMVFEFWTVNNGVTIFMDYLGTYV